MGANAMVAAVANGLDAKTRLLMWWVRAEYWLARTVLPDVYASDGLISFHNDAFLDNPEFQRAYQRGARALPDQDWYQWQWRVHVGLWAAESASKLDGDFVECGVSYGFLSSAIMEHLDWDRLGKTFYLLDTFAGIDSRFVTDAERQDGEFERSQLKLRNGMYVSGVEGVRANFAQWQNQRIIVGAVPETLDASRGAHGGLPTHRHELCSTRNRRAALFLAATFAGRLCAPRRLRESRTRRAARRHGRLGSRIGRGHLRLTDRAGPADQAGTVTRSGFAAGGIF